MAKNDPTSPDELDEPTAPTLPLVEISPPAKLEEAAAPSAGPGLPERPGEKPAPLARQPLGKTVLVKVEDVSEGVTIPVPAVELPLNTSGPGSPVIMVRNLTKTYVLGGKTSIPALRGVSLDVYSGEFVAIMGPSGSGKSTFMNLLGCLDRPTSGEYWLAGRLVSRLSSDELAAMRNQLLGFVFQGFNLLGRANAVKNVALPMVYAGLSRREREKRARKVLQLVGLGGRLDHKPPEMSGGQQQRVAIARALVNGPSLLLADEPTGNLDSRTSIEIMGVLQALNEQGLTIVLVTHDANIAAYAKRQVAFLDGRIVRDEQVLSQRSAQREWEALTPQNVPSSATTPVVGEAPW